MNQAKLNEAIIDLNRAAKTIVQNGKCIKFNTWDRWEENILHTSSEGIYNINGREFMVAWHNHNCNYIAEVTTID